MSEPWSCSPRRQPPTAPEHSATVNSPVCVQYTGILQMSWQACSHNLFSLESLFFRLLGGLQPHMQGFGLWFPLHTCRAVGGLHSMRPLSILCACRNPQSSRFLQHTHDFKTLYNSLETLHMLGLLDQGMNIYAYASTHMEYFLWELLRAQFLSF